MRIAVEDAHRKALHAHAVLAHEVGAREAGVRDGHVLRGEGHALLPGRGAVAMDARNHNPFGRIFQFSLTKRF